jgi:hypothetical protein
MENILLKRLKKSEQLMFCGTEWYGYFNMRRIALLNSAQR